jgi:hypothetical protein
VSRITFRLNRYPQEALTNTGIGVVTNPIPITRVASVGYHPVVTTMVAAVGYHPVAITLHSYVTVTNNSPQKTPKIQNAFTGIQRLELNLIMVYLNQFT